jgi:hypothetical protein
LTLIGIGMGSISLLVIYYKFGTVALFCTVGGLMVGSLIERLGWN